MKKLFFLFLAAGLLLAFNANSAAAQSASTSTFSGMAVRWNGEAIAGATIAALRGPLETDAEVAHTVTAADGSYTLTVPAGETYWLHIRTFGTYWGYSYYIPFTPRAGETISKVYFALGPRDVKDVITLPTPESNVKPIVGSNDEAPVQPQKPATQPHKPATLPTTGAADGATLGLWTLLALAGLGLVGSGLSLHALRMRKG